MARALTEIYDQLVAEKEAKAELTGLLPDPDSAADLINDVNTNTTSKTAVWRLQLFVMAFGIWVHEQIFDQHKAEIQAFADTLIGGTSRWLRSEAFKFQLGDSLSFDEDTQKFSYPIINTANQIIKRASVQEIGGQVRLKVAKEDTGGNPVPLDASELTAFTAYINQIKFAGTNTSITSNPADELIIEFDVYYDPILMDGTGTLLSDGSTKPIEVAIQNYLDNIPFNGVLNLTKLVDAVQAATGVVDPILTSAQARFGANPFANIDREYLADSGYLVIDAANPLSGTITYIANG